MEQPKKQPQSDRGRLARECAKLDPNEERQLAEEGLFAPNTDTIAIERTLLAFLCGGNGRGQRREKIIAQLGEYTFQSVEHQVLFDCLQAMPLERPALVRELLPARLVRAGFPDFDLAPFLEAGEAGAVSEDEARRLCRELTRGVGSGE